MVDQKNPDETPAVPLPADPLTPDAAITDAARLQSEDAGAFGATPTDSDMINDPAVATLSIDTSDMSSAEDTCAGTGATGGSKAREAIREQAEKLTGKAGEQARGFAAQGKERATGALDELARMIDEAAGAVDERIGAQYGQYARSAAGAVSGFADNLRGKEVDELVDDLRDFVRKSPAVAIGTAAALGFVLTRVLRSGFDGDNDRGAA